MRKRAEKAERLLQALTEASSSSSPSSESSTKRVIMEYEERVQRAEIAREEADSRRRAVLDNWTQLDRWLQMVEFRALDARESFGRIVREGGGQLTLGSIGTPLMALSTPSMAPPPLPSSQPPRRHATRTPMTPFPSLPPLPPLPPTTSSTTTTSRRARTPSLESEYTHPPSKRSRGNGEPRMSFSDSVSTTSISNYPRASLTSPRLSISIWSSMDTRPQLLLESSCPPAITINRTRTLTLHIPICIRIPIMYIRVDRIPGLQVALAALRWTLTRCSFARPQPTKSTASLRINHHHLWPVFLYQPRPVKMVPRIYATTHEDTARIVVVVVVVGAYMSIRVNKHKKERGMRIRLVSLSRERRCRRAWDCTSNSRGEEDNNPVHWFNRVRFSSIRRMSLRRSLRVHQ